MNKYDPYKRITGFIFAFVILSFQTANFWTIWNDFYSKNINQPFFRRGNWLVITIYAFLLFFFTLIYGGYKIGYYKKIDLIFSQILCTLFVNSITYLQISLLGLGFMNVAPMSLLTGIEVIFTIIWTYVFGTIYKRIYPPHKLLLIFGESSISHLIQKMEDRKDKYQICESISIDNGMDRIIEKIQSYDAVVIWDIPAQTRNLLLKYCFSNSIQAYVMPKISDIILIGSDKIDLFDSPLLLSKNLGLSADQRIMKRLLDILISSAALILLSPIMILTALAIKCYDGGPIFYKQVRLTKNSNTFPMYKFRSMKVDAEESGVALLATKNDDRITPIGRIIRSLRIDEIPQFINILAGDMSVVGPRPERPEIAGELRKVMPEFDFRLKVKAGLTGYAQVYGKYNTSAYDKLKMDLTYIMSSSIWLDIKLVILTIKILFKKESTEGFDT